RPALGLAQLARILVQPLALELAVMLPRIRIGRCCHPLRTSASSALRRMPSQRRGRRGTQRRSAPTLGIVASLWLLLVSAVPAADPTYWQDIRPVLRKNCTVCHSTKNLKEPDVSGGLALDSYAAIRKGTQHAILEPGKSDASVLIQRVTTEDG